MKVELITIFCRVYTSLLDDLNLHDKLVHEKVTRP